MMKTEKKEMEFLLRKKRKGSKVIAIQRSERQIVYLMTAR